MRSHFSSILIAAAAFIGMSAWSTPASANHYQPEHGYRYRTTYYSWDRGLYGYYGYREENCDVRYRAGRRVYTCYDMEPTAYLYIEERHMSGGYTRVTVYQYEHDSIPYAEYYVYNDGYTRRVEARHFYHHPYYHDHYYYSPYYGYHQTVWVSLDWDNGFDKIIVGGYTALVGAALLDGADNDFERALGLGSMAAGSISMSMGSDQLERESELAQYIDKNKNSDDDGTDIR